MKIKEHDRVELVRDLPAQDRRLGDRGTVVHVYEEIEDVEVEFDERKEVITVWIGDLDLVP